MKNSTSKNFVYIPIQVLKGQV